MTQVQHFQETRRRSHGFLFLLVAMVVVSFGWAVMGRLEVVSRATGEVIPFSRIKTVQHLEGGIVREIRVKEGEAVEMDQPLVILESTARFADVAEQIIQRDSLQVKIHRLLAEIRGDETLTFPAEMETRHPDLTRRAVAIFTNRKERLKGEIRIQKALISQYRYQIEEIQGRLSGTTRVKNFIEEQVAISEKLLKHSLSNRMNHIDLLKQLADLKAQQRVDSAALKRMNAAIDEAQGRLELVNTTFLEEAYDALRDAQRTLEIITERLQKDEDTLQRTVLRSPVEGTVKTLFVATIGGIVTPGGAVADIVPTEDRLIIEARLPVGEIGYVHQGQPVMLRLASSGFERLGRIDGEVLQISPDSILQKEGPPYYKVKISTHQDFFGPPDKPYRLFPGMLIQCDIITDTRSVLDYLIDPFLLSLETALQER